MKRLGRLELQHYFCCGGAGISRSDLHTLTKNVASPKSLHVCLGNAHSCVSASSGPQLQHTYEIYAHICICAEMYAQYIRKHYSTRRHRRKAVADVEGFALSAAAEDISAYESMQIQIVEELRSAKHPPT